MNTTQWNNMLNAPLLILQLLQNYTMNDFKLKDRNQVLSNIEELKYAIRKVNENILLQSNLVGKAQECDLTMNLIVTSDMDGCIIHQAVAERNYRAVGVLIEKGAKLNGNCEGSTALHVAVENNDRMMIDFLLSKGINSQIVNDEGYTPLQLAVKMGFDQAVELLSEEVPVTRDNAGNSLAHLAAAAGHISILETLTKKSHSILESRNYRGETLLLAAAHGHKNTVEALKRLGANLRAFDSDFNTVLHKAVDGGFNGLVRYILQQSRSYLNTMNKCRNTPLHLALQAGQRDVVGTLFSYGANLNITGEFGNTVLHFAAVGDLDNYVQYFVNRYHIPVDIMNEEYSTPLHKASSANSYKAAQALLDNGANPNAVNRLTRTPIHLVALNKANKIAKLLCRSGATKHAKDYQGYTPSALAAKSKHFELAYELEYVIPCAT